MPTRWPRKIDPSSHGQIGINYIGQQNELHGCIDDANDIRKFLIRMYNSDIEMTSSYQ
jgi:hypothetical protein